MQLMTTCRDTLEELCKWGKWAQIDNQYIKETKTKHKELGRGINHWGGRHNATDAMDKVLPGSTRIWDQREYIVPGLHENNVIIKEQEEIQH